jgi:hypothetical protein
VPLYEWIKFADGPRLSSCGYWGRGEGPISKGELILRSETKTSNSLPAPLVAPPIRREPSSNTLKKPPAHPVLIELTIFKSRLPVNAVSLHLGTFASDPGAKLTAVSKETSR